jgi:tripartite-type tricarboxylate transporter receptor subunit TctC
MFSRQVMAWPFVAPPGVPRERIEALRTAFTAAMQDKDFLADANKGNLEVRPVTGADMQKLINDVAQTQPALMQRTTQLLAQ